MSVPAAQALRHRAAALRHHADAIEHAAVFGLDPIGPEPRFELCHRLLSRNLTQLRDAVTDLRDAAWQLDTRANHLDR